MSPSKSQTRSSRVAAIRAAAPSVLPSLLQCDFGDLRREVERLVQAGTKVLHLDVMDGHFVPNLTYGMPIVEGLRRHTDLPLDVHLMIQDPLAYARPMVDAGADMLTFHAEVFIDAGGKIEQQRIVDAAATIADMDVCVGIAINPDTPLSAIESAIASVDMVLIMSVNAGFGGQKFNPVALKKLRELRSRHPELLLEIDGGINASTIGSAREAGCDLFVVGSAIFGHDDYGQAVTALDQRIAAAGGVIQNSDAKGSVATGAEVN